MPKFINWWKKNSFSVLFESLDRITNYYFHLIWTREMLNLYIFLGLWTYQNVENTIILSNSFSFDSAWKAIHMHFPKLLYKLGYHLYKKVISISYEKKNLPNLCLFWKLTKLRARHNQLIKHVTNTRLTSAENRLYVNFKLLVTNLLDVGISHKLMFIRYIELYCLKRIKKYA